MADNDRTIEIGGEPLATIEFTPDQITINTCCDSVSIFDEHTAMKIILEMCEWVNQKRRLDSQRELP